MQIIMIPTSQIRVHDEYATLFRCPRCRGELAPHPSDLPDASGAVEGFTCGACRVRYPAHDGIVNFTPDDAIADVPDGSTLLDPDAGRPVVETLRRAAAE